MKLQVKVVTLEYLVYRGEWLVEAREKAGLTQQGFADRVGWSVQRQSYLERPGRHQITEDTVARIDLALSLAEEQKEPKE